MTAKKLMVYGIVLLSMFFWSLTYIWYKIVFTELTPITVMTFRLGISSIFLLLFSKLTGRLQIPEKSDFLWFFALSVFQPLLYFLGESYGVRLVSPTIAAVIISTIPVFTPVVAYIFYRDKISALNIFGIIISFFGVLLVILGRNLKFEGSIMGIMYLSGALISALGYSVIIVKLTRKYNTLSIISWQNLLGWLLFLPLFFIFDFENFKTAEFTQPVILNLLYLALLGSTVAYIFFTYGIKNLGITRASLFTNLIPIFTAIFAYTILNEELGMMKFIGVCVVITGLFLGQTGIKSLYKSFFNK